MKRFIGIAALVWVVVAVMACGGTPLRYFHFVPNDTTVTKPDSCYQPESLGNPTDANQIAAQAFCGATKKPSETVGQSATGIFTRDTFVLEEGMDGSYYLTLSEASAMKGTYKDGKYTFTGKNSKWNYSDDQRQMIREDTLNIVAEPSGAYLKLTQTTVTDYRCVGSRCSSDYSARCPSCTVTAAGIAREIPNVTEWHSNGL